MNPEQHQSFPGSLSQRGCNVRFFKIAKVARAGRGTPTEPHHTPSPEATPLHYTTSLIPLPSFPTAPIPIPTVTQTDTTLIIQYSRRARIAQSSAPPTVTDEPASLVRDDSQGEACPTDSALIADQDRATIAKSSTLPVIQHQGLLPLLLKRA
nr:hypothetical protein [Tanacetum cinerariifolium]